MGHSSKAVFTRFNSPKIVLPQKCNIIAVKKKSKGVYRVIYAEADIIGIVRAGNPDPIIIQSGAEISEFDIRILREGGYDVVSLQ